MKLPDDSPNYRGKILDHDAGLGEVDKDEIEQRARELAEIAGFTPDQVNDGHRYQARQELLGADGVDQPNDDDGTSGLASADDIPGESGGSVFPATNAAANSDEQSAAEILYSEGVDEADHDRMVASREQEENEES